MHSRARLVDVFAHAHFAGTHDRRYAFAVHAICLCVHARFNGVAAARAHICAREARYARYVVFTVILARNNNNSAGEQAGGSACKFSAEKNGNLEKMQCH